MVQSAEAVHDSVFPGQHDEGAHDDATQVAGLAACIVEVEENGGRGNGYNHQRKGAHGHGDGREEQGYTLRTNLNYRNKSLNENVPQGE